MTMHVEADEAVHLRLRRIEGQVRGLERMLDEGADVEQFLTQLSAVHAALTAVGMCVVARRLHEALCDDQRSPDEEGVLLTAVDRLVRR